MEAVALGQETIY